jgi:hypothetical protein
MNTLKTLRPTYSSTSSVELVTKPVLRTKVVEPSLISEAIADHTMIPIAT